MRHHPDVVLRLPQVLHRFKYLPGMWTFVFFQLLSVTLLNNRHWHKLLIVVTKWDLTCITITKTLRIGTLAVAALFLFIIFFASASNSKRGGSK